MRVRYTVDAQQHIERIRAYIAERSPGAALRIVQRIRDAAMRLTEHPYIGRFGAAPGTHEWVVRRSPYIIVYEVHPADDELVILAVFHGAQDRDRGPGPAR